MPKVQSTTYKSCPVTTSHLGATREDPRPHVDLLVSISTQKDSTAPPVHAPAPVVGLQQLNTLAPEHQQTVGNSWTILHLDSPGQTHRQLVPVEWVVGAPGSQHCGCWAPRPPGNLCLFDRVQGLKPVGIPPPPERCLFQDWFQSDNQTMEEP